MVKSLLKMGYKKYIIASVFLIGLLFASLFIQSKLTKKDIYQNEFSEKYRVYAVTIPGYLNFCGEKTPMNDYDVFERFDRELTINTYYQSSTIFNIKRGSRYFPVIEPILRRNGIPDDFKYLCMIESGLSNVISPNGAVGFWQFIEETGRNYGLRINDEVDERYDIRKSTEAACAYFKEAYLNFGSWTLAAASYNIGINGLKGALNKQDVNSYYDLYLNSETSRYIMRVLAIKEIYEHPNNYGYYVPQFLRYPQIPTYAETVRRSIPDLTVYAKAHNISYKVFKIFNPWLRKNELKNRDSSVYTFYFPQPGAEQQVSDFYGYGDEADSTEVKPVDSAVVSKVVNDTLIYVEVKHKVEKHETIDDIAKRYLTTAPKIMLWNNLEFATLKTDQVLVLLIRKDLLGKIKLQGKPK
jgi:membrane-bound lytic murein transglycosylase D